MQLTSMQNPKIKQIKKLKNKRERDRSQTFLIEGYREIMRAYEGGVRFLDLFYNRNLFLGENEESLMEAMKVPSYELSEDIFSKISYRDRPDGLLATAQMEKPSPERLRRILERKNPLILVAEAVEKPGNLGAILRSVDATGCDGLIVADRCTDIYNPNVIRSSVGTLFAVEVFERDNDEIAGLMQEYGISLVATTPDASSLYYEADLTGPAALLVGTEQLGLSSFWLERADQKVKLPMLGKVDSLNVANASTVVLYEAIRQRRFIS